MITPMASIYAQDEGRISDPESPVNMPKKTTLVTPRPSSPREFFARIYGHLESEKSKTIHPVEKNLEENHDELLTDSSSDVDMNDGSLQMMPNIYESNENASRYNENSAKAENSSATAALVQLAAGSVPLTAGSSGINRFSGLPGLSGLQNIPGFLPPRPPFLFSGELPFPTGLSAFLSRRRRGPGRSRRQRTTFSAAQTLRLEVEFRRAEYVGRPRRLELAASLRLSETQVKIWFQNRRAKDKRIEKAHIDHHYRTLAGLQPEYYSSFAAAGTCGICLYKRESPCSHFLQQNARSQGTTTPVAQCAEKFIQHSDILTN